MLCPLATHKGGQLLCLYFANKVVLFLSLESEPKTSGLTSIDIARSYQTGIGRLRFQSCNPSGSRVIECIVSIVKLCSTEANIEGLTVINY